MPAVKTRGHFVWYELATSDPAAAQRFYSAITGWGAQAFEGERQYTLHHVDEWRKAHWWTLAAAE
jgi:predicted enzyme related to lactoylglutathione lyase